MHGRGGRAGLSLEAQKRAISLELISAVQASRSGQIQDAVRRQRGAIESCRRLHLRSVEGVLGRVLGAYLHQAGASAEAVGLYEELVVLAHDLGAPDEEAEIRLGQGIALIWTRDADAAVESFSRGTELASATDLRGLVEEGHRLAAQLRSLWSASANPAHAATAMSSLSRLAEKFWFRGVSEQSQALNAAEPSPPAAEAPSAAGPGGSGGQGPAGSNPTQRMPAVRIPPGGGPPMVAAAAMDMPPDAPTMANAPSGGAQDDEGAGFDDLSDEVTGVFRPSQMGFVLEAERSSGRAPPPAPKAAPPPAPKVAPAAEPPLPPLDDFDDLESESTVVHGSPHGRGGHGGSRG
jgi:hypothetical protein